MTTFGMVAIVKDEAARIERCLASAIAAGVSVATIVDTGSSDGTPELVTEACAGIDLRLHRSPFVNMGVTRSVAFSLAHGSADWLLALDADMTVEIDPDFIPDPAVDCYSLAMNSGAWSWRLPLLLRGDLLWKSNGAYHEWTGRADDLPWRSEPTDAVRVSFVTPPRTRQKSHWIMALLEDDLAAKPDDTRTLFYLAQEYRDTGDPRARDLYLRRVALGGWEEECWWAQYQAALLAPWPARADELVATWERRPSRLEPVRDLVREWNVRGLHHAAYALASVPIGECRDTTFMEPAVWAWGLKFERGIAAWWVGHPDECRDLMAEVLAHDDIPADVRAAARRNLDMCEPALAA
jgi:hypothetical protein